MNEPTIIQCLEADRREWLSCLHQADQQPASEYHTDKQEPEPKGGEPAATKD